jgi:glycerol-3-phosphate dehydrogenase
LHGALGAASSDDTLRAYGSDAPDLLRLADADPALGERLDPRLPYTGAHVVYGVRAEMARTVDDVLARRTRALFLDAAAARSSAPRVAALMALELGRDAVWANAQTAAFEALAARWNPTGEPPTSPT